MQDEYNGSSNISVREMAFFVHY